MGAARALNRNGWLLLGSKGMRSFGIGLLSITLGLHLAALGFGALQIGLVFSVGLAGTVLLTLLVAGWGDRIGRRRILVAGGALIALSAVLAYFSDNLLMLTAVAAAGMLSASNTESNGLQTIDQAVLPQTVGPQHWTAAFALYHVVAHVAAAAGALAVGPVVALGHFLDWGQSAFASTFAVYAVCGVASALIAHQLDERVESTIPRSRSGGLHRSRRPVAELSALFAVDSLAGGLIIQSYLAAWMASRFGLDASAIGVLFGVGSLLTAASFPMAALVAQQIGLVRTMVYTHLPANIALLALAFVTDTMAAVGLFLLRALLASMDMPTRQSYAMGIVEADERTATAGVTSLARSTAQVFGPVLTGILTALGPSAPIVASAVLKVTYDGALWLRFNDREPVEPEAVTSAVPIDAMWPPEDGALSR